MSVTQGLKKLLAKDSIPAAPAPAAPNTPETERGGGMCPDWGKGKVLHWSGRRIVQATDQPPAPTTWPPKPHGTGAEPPIPEFLRKG